MMNQSTSQAENGIPALFAAAQTYFYRRAMELGKRNGDLACAVYATAPRILFRALDGQMPYATHPDFVRTWAEIAKTGGVPAVDDSRGLDSQFADQRPARKPGPSRLLLREYPRLIGTGWLAFASDFIKPRNKTKKGQNERQISASYVLWLNYDKIPKYDDWPYLNSLYGDGYCLIRPESLRKCTHVSLGRIRSIIHEYLQLVERVGYEIACLNAGGATPSGEFIETLVQEYRKPVVMRPILRALLLEIPNIERFLESAHLTSAVVSRSGAHPVLPVITNRAGKSDKGVRAKSILIPHSVPTRSWVAGSGYFYANAVLMPTARCFENLAYWHPEIEAKSRVLLKPRYQALNDVRRNRAITSQTQVMIAITDSEVGNCLGASRESLSSLTKTLERNEVPFLLKQKNPPLVRSQWSGWSLRAPKPDGSVTHKITRKSLTDLVSLCSVAFVIPSSRVRYISNVTVDLIAAGVPTIVVSPDTADAAELYDNYDQSFDPIIKERLTVERLITEGLRDGELAEIASRTREASRRLFGGNGARDVREHFRQIIRTQQAGIE